MTRQFLGLRIRNFQGIVLCEHRHIGRFSSFVLALDESRFNFVIADLANHVIFSRNIARDGSAMTNWKQVKRMTDTV